MADCIKIITLAIDYIETHLNEKLDLEIVAKSVNYSKYHLHRMFTSTIGLTIHDYIQRRKLTEAAKMLVFSDLSIFHIALTAGYESQQSFTSVFKAMYKKTPNQYREEEEFYPLQLKYVLKNNPVKFDKQSGRLQQNITFANKHDISIWMDLVKLVIDGFPYLKEDEYIENLQQCIDEKRALILKDGNIAIGIMAFNYANGSIDFFGIHPQYRKQGMAKAFIAKAFKEIMPQKEISITTFRKGDKADTGYNDEYKRLGFREAELLVEFGYPTQKFVLQRQLLEDSTNE